MSKLARPPEGGASSLGERAQGGPCPAPHRPGLALGMGCDRGTPLATIARAVAEALARVDASLEDVAAVASIDLKADEEGLAKLALLHGWTIRFYPAAELAAVPVPNPSETVRRYTGTPSVAEAAALLAAGAGGAGLVLEKHRLRGPDGRSATVSIARLDGAAAATPFFD